MDHGTVEKELLPQTRSLELYSPTNSIHAITTDQQPRATCDKKPRLPTPSSNAMSTITRRSSQPHPTTSRPATPTHTRARRKQQTCLPQRQPPRSPPPRNAKTKTSPTLATPPTHPSAPKRILPPKPTASSAPTKHCSRTSDLNTMSSPHP